MLRDIIQSIFISNMTWRNMLEIIAVTSEASEEVNFHL